VWAEPPPQVSTALFGLTEVFGSTTGGKNQGKTGQGGSAAIFFPGTASVGSDKDPAPLEWVVKADHKAMRALANNRSFRETSASRRAADTRAAEAAPGWTGAGADYAA